LKWAFAGDGGLQDSGCVLHHGEPARALQQLPVVTVDSVWLAHVTGPAHEASFDQALRTHYGQAPQYARSSAQWRGLRNAYREPERLGVDRWLVLMAAWHERQGAACVVDAGTALTADAIDGSGQHQGGFIAGGLETQQRAVLGATRFPVRDAAQAYQVGLGRDTESCVRQGALLACVGAVERAAQLAGADARCLLTGGDAEHLQPLLDARWQWRPQLVLEGLLALAQPRE
jgi:type III pantothenate kinase